MVRGSKNKAADFGIADASSYVFHSSGSSKGRQNRFENAKVKENGHMETKETKVLLSTDFLEWGPDLKPDVMLKVFEGHYAEKNKVLRLPSRRPLWSYGVC